jgi:hypothetical protein
MVYIIGHFLEGHFHVLFHMVHAKDAPSGVFFNLSFESSKIFGLFLFLVLVDGGFLNALLSVDLFPSTLTHLL